MFIQKRQEVVLYPLPCGSDPKPGRARPVRRSFCKSVDCCSSVRAISDWATHSQWTSDESDDIWVVGEQFWLVGN